MNSSHFNDEAGAVWMQRMLGTYRKAAWLNPEPQHRWEYTQSIRLTRELLEDRMYPLTIAGIDDCMRSLQ